MPTFLKFSKAQDKINPSGFRVTFLGTSSSRPTPKRNVTSALFSTDNSTWVIDCGEGTQQQLLRATQSKFPVGALITHMHGDHIYGLPGILCSLLAGPDTPTPRRSDGEYSTEPFRIFGPLGITEFIRTIVELTTTTSWLDRRFSVTELIWTKKQHQSYKGGNGGENDVLHIHPWEPTLIYENEKLKISACPIHHTVPCLGYMFHEKDRPGVLNIQKLQRLGIPQGKIYGEIKNKTEYGLSVLPPGVSYNDVVSGPKKGRKAVILGDTSNPRGFIPEAIGCDLLVHECTYGEEDHSSALSRGHSTAKMAGKFAQELQTQNLILTHFSPKMAELSQILELIDQAKSEYSGPIRAAEDFLVVDVERAG